MSASDKSLIDTSAKTAAEEILRMLQRYGVVFVNRVLFEGKSPEQLENIKARIQEVINKHRQ